MNRRIENIFNLKHERDKHFDDQRSVMYWNLEDGFFKIYKNEPEPIRQGKAIAYAISKEKLTIYPEDRIAGRVFQTCIGGVAPFMEYKWHWKDYAATKLVHEEVDQNPEYWKNFVEYYGYESGAGHITWHWNLLLEKGIKGFKEEITEKYLNKETDPQKRRFYEGVVLSYEGLEAFIEAGEKYIKELMKDNTYNKDNLEYMLKNLHNTLYPSKDFASALQLFLIQHIAVMLENPHGGNGPGRMDRYLWPYLKDEWESGKLNHDQVLEMIEETFMIMDDRIAPIDSWVEAVIVGGCDENGECSVNPLSYIMIEAMMELKNQTHPGVYVSLSENAPEDFVDLCAEYIIKGHNRGQVYSDENIRKAMVKDGFDYKETCDFYAGGCMEVGVQGKMGDMHFAYALNVPLILEIVINGGKTFDGKYHFNCPYKKTLCDYESFDEFYKAFEEEYIREINMMHNKIDLATLGYKNHRPMYLMSSMVDDCLGRGKSINDGGEIYGNYGGSVVGCANVGDSLYSIKKIFEDKKYTKEEVLNALRNDYKDNELMRLYFLNLPKYGSGCKEATELTDKVMEIHNKTVKNYNNAMGGHGVSIILGFVWSGSYGEHVGASPDGRHAKRALSQGMTPQNGACTEGITTGFIDATKLSLENVAGGASMMWDLDPKWATKDVVKALMKSYFAMGGHIFQGNVMNKEILQEALLNPEDYRDLIVRVGGYSDKFVKLSPSLQQEIIHRYVHSS